MPLYALLYHGARPVADPDEAASRRAAFGRWLSGLGDAVVTPGVPLTENVRVASDGATSPVGDDRITGYTVLEAEGLDEAVAMARTCPFLEMGELEVAHAGAMG